MNIFVRTHQYYSNVLAATIPARNVAIDRRLSGVEWVWAQCGDLRDWGGGYR